MSSEGSDHRSGHSESDLVDAYAQAVWRQFESRFPTEESAIEALHSALLDLKEDLDICGSCGCPNSAREQGARVVDCLRCGRSKWFTAGTFFHGVKRPRAWLATLWLMDHGVVLNSFRLHKLLGIAYSSALTMFKKITTVVHTAMESDSMLVPSGAFLSIICKRSRETLAREHPVSEQLVMDRSVTDESTNASTHTQCGNGTQPFRNRPSSGINVGEPGERELDASVQGLNELSTQPIAVFDCDGVELLHELLASGPVSFDELCERGEITPARLASSLTILELNGVVRSMPGDRYALITPRRSPLGCSSEMTLTGVDSQSVVGQAIAYVENGFHGISRKYLQNYLAAYWLFRDRAKWSVGRLLDSCMRFRHILDREIVAYVSPPMVMLPSVQTDGQ